MKEFSSSSNSGASIVDHADANVMAVQQAQDLAAIKNAAKRQAERQEKYELWSDPEAMEYRRILHAKESFESLRALKVSGQCVLQCPVPPDSELPKHLRGQQPSTLRKLLAGDPEWEKKVAAHEKTFEKVESRRDILRKKYPELFGITAAVERQELEGKSIDDYRIGTGKPAFTIKDGKAAPEAVLANLVSRIFSGLWKR